MKPSERLAELKIQLPAVPKPVGSYVPAVKSGPWISTSGQLPLEPWLPAIGAVDEMHAHPLDLDRGELTVDEGLEPSPREPMFASAHAPATLRLGAAFRPS